AYKARAHNCRIGIRVGHLGGFHLRLVGRASRSRLVYLLKPMNATVIPTQCPYCSPAVKETKIEYEIGWLLRRHMRDYLEKERLFHPELRWHESKTFGMRS